MVGAGRLSRGDVWLVALNPTLGSEIQKTRPCVIVSPDEIHNHIRTVLVAPLTSGSRPAPARIKIAFDKVDGFVMLEHIRSVDRLRLTKKLGRVDDEILADILKTLREMFRD
ncbi:MAG TPA: type II toxin-antitoxin system PemK/MazF family toxin [Asticcacaulis sp.]|nr:type II toxin-antitoxin system PemK/MazF family toxin [Asticcacaulis sp.]